MSDTADSTGGSTADEMIDYKKIHDESIQGDGSGDPNDDREFLQDLPPAQVGDGTSGPDGSEES
jgi:hypothetical protein